MQILINIFELVQNSDQLAKCANPEGLNQLPFLKIAVPGIFNYRQ